MSTVVIDGLSTRYAVQGSGPALLMFSPGGFDADLDSWATVGIYRRLGLLERLAEHYTCITFDRRESGCSGGRLQRLDWSDYVRQASGLLDHLGIDRAHLMGGCVGCSTAAALAVAHPERVQSMVLYSPAGGARYRLKQHARLAEHLVFAQQHGLAAVADLAASHDKGFSADPRVGPWVAVLRSDPDFAAGYRRFDLDRYALLLRGTARLLFDRDTVPGTEPEDLLALDIPALIVPGADDSHATSAARYLQECLPRADYWDVPVDLQTAQSVPPRLLEFLATVDQDSDSPRSNAAI